MEVNLVTAPADRQAITVSLSPAGGVGAVSLSQRPTTHVGATVSGMRVAMMTREYPPEVYGGAGVHVTELVAQLRRLCEVDVHCMGVPRPGALAHQPDPALANANPALATLSADLRMANAAADATVVHSHTWYTGMAGHIASLLHGVPHVLTAHSLEPLRPWKAEQLGGGYAISSWAEKTAYEGASAIIAVSDGMRADVLTSYPDVDPKKVVTIRNGVDTLEWSPIVDPSVAESFGINGRYAIFVGRITRQKGLAHLLRAWSQVPDEYGLVLCAGSADEAGIGAEFEELVSQLQKTRKNIWWIKEMLPKPQLIPLLTGADLFLCPSIYEPLGIVNLEAMACQTAVLASRVGGIPEVVDDGVTGKLVDYTTASSIFESNIAAGINEMMGDPERLKRFGIAGRNRAINEFGWDAVAAATIALYRSVL
jgi:starch synthase